MADLENRVSNIETKIDMFIGEMRDRDNQRAAEIAKLSQKHDADIKEMRQNHEADMKEMCKKQEADMKEIRNSLDGMGKHVRNIAIAAIVGIGAISASVIGFFVTTLLK